jgi:hypothetical protein
VTKVMEDLGTDSQGDNVLYRWHQSSMGTMSTRPSLPSTLSSDTITNVVLVDNITDENLASEIYHLQFYERKEYLSDCVYVVCTILHYTFQLNLSLSLIPRSPTLHASCSGQIF